MSRVYFHTQTHTAEIMGSERGWLRHLASSTARGWWGLDDKGPLDRALDIAGMIVPGSCGQYVRAAMVDSNRYSIPRPTDNHIAIAVWAYWLARDQSSFERDANGRQLLVESVRVVVADVGAVEYAPGTVAG